MPPPTQTPFGNWLRRQIVARDMTQAEFAERAGFNKGVVSKWVTGRLNPRPDSLERIADALHVSIDEVLDASGLRPYVAYDDPQVTRLVNKLRNVQPTTERMDLLDRVLDGMLEMDRMVKDAARRRAKLDGRDG